MHTAYLLLGSNLGNRLAILRDAVLHLNETAGTVEAASGLYETAAWGLEDQPAFFNQAVRLQTKLTPDLLLDACQQVELLAGRERLVRWGARTLDVDILLYDNLVLNSARLTVPHPRLAERRFALVPLLDIAAGVVHPELRLTVAELLAACTDRLLVQKIEDLSSGQTQ